MAYALLLFIPLSLALRYIVDAPGDLVAGAIVTSLPLNGSIERAVATIR